MTDEKFKLASVAYKSALNGLTVLVIGQDTQTVAIKVKKLIEQQAIVAFIYNDPMAATALCNEVEQTLGDRPLYVHCDIRDAHQLTYCMNLVSKQLGWIDVLMNDKSQCYFNNTPNY